MSTEKVSDKVVYGFHVDDSICLLYGVRPRHCGCIPESGIRSNAENMDYGVMFAENVEKYIHIAKTRDYNRDIYVTVSGNNLLIGHEPKPGWFLVRPDTIGEIAFYLHEKNVDAYPQLVCSYGDTVAATIEGLSTALSHIWNNAY